jgi:predicted metal-dependent hydrolase
MSTGNQKQSICEFKFGQDKVTCHIYFCDIKKLRVIVYPDQRVEARSPLRYDETKVLEQVKKRAHWIIKQREYFGQFTPRLPEKHYVSGETFYYLGRQYRLKIRKEDNYSVKLKGKFIWVTTPVLSQKNKVKELVQRWYQGHALSTFERRLQIRFKDAQRYGISYPDIKIRHMNKRWGSCGNNGSILLNTELVKAPIYCVDYVITHELCHLKYPKHDSQFYRLLSVLMPNWEHCKQRLEKVTI